MQKAGVRGGRDGEDHCLCGCRWWLRVRERIEWMSARKGRSSRLRKLREMGRCRAALDGSRKTRPTGRSSRLQSTSFPCCLPFSLFSCKDGSASPTAVACILHATDSRRGGGDAAKDALEAAMRAKTPTRPSSPQTAHLPTALSNRLSLRACPLDSLGQIAEPS